MEDMEAMSFILFSESILLALAYHSLVCRKKRRRSSYVRSILERRQQRGEFRNLVSELRLGDSEYYYKYFRMTACRFEELLRKVVPLLGKRSTHRDPIVPAERLAMTLRYLSHGDSQQSVAFGYRVGLSTMCNIVKEVCDALWVALGEEFVCAPRTAAEWKNIATNFHRKWNFPNCVGAIDGKHINIVKPKNSGSTFYNYKHRCSVILMAVCDGDYCFTLVDIGSAGRLSDGGVFANTSFAVELEKDTFPLPLPEKVQEPNVTLPYVFVGDEAFPLKKYLMRPYPRRDLDQEKRIFNYRLSRARRIVENAFGILATKWQIFRKEINAKPEKVVSMVKACIALHNFLRKSDLQDSEKQRPYIRRDLVDTEDNNGKLIYGEWRTQFSSNGALGDIGQTGSNFYDETAKEIRKGFTRYFMSPEGALPWQNTFVV